MTIHRDGRSVERAPVVGAAVLCLLAAGFVLASVTDISLWRAAWILCAAVVMIMPLGSVAARWVLPAPAPSHVRIGLTIGLGVALAPMVLLFTARFGTLGLLAPLWIALAIFLFTRRSRQGRSVHGEPTADSGGSPEEAVSVVALLTGLSLACVAPLLQPLREATSTLFVNYAYIDTYFHSNLVQALMRHTPLTDWPNVAGMAPLFYQDFHHMLMAALARLGGVSATDMFFLYAPVVVVTATVVLAYAVGRAVTGTRVGGYLSAALQYVVLVPNVYDRNLALQAQWSVVLPNFYQIHFYNLRYAQHAASGWILLLAIVLCWTVALRATEARTQTRVTVAACVLLGALFRFRPQYFLCMAVPTAVLTLWISRRRPFTLVAGAVAGAVAMAWVLYPYETLRTNSSGLVLKYGVFAARVTRAGYFLPNAVTRVLALVPGSVRPAVGLAAVIAMRTIGLNLLLLILLGARRLWRSRESLPDRIEPYLWLAIASAYLMALFVEQSATDGNLGWNILQAAVAPALLLATAAIVSLVGGDRLDAFWSRRRAGILAVAAVLSVVAFRGAEATMHERMDRAYPITDKELAAYAWIHANVGASEIVAADPRHRVNANAEMLQNTNFLSGMTERSVYAQYLSPLTRPEVDRRIAELAAIYDAASADDACARISATTATVWLEYPDRRFTAGSLPCLVPVLDSGIVVYRRVVR